MRPETKRQALAAIDLGAQSCRVSLLRWTGAEPEIRVVHRFANAPVQTASGLRWDLRRILDGVLDGLRQAAAFAPEGIASIGVDGWAVDYVRVPEKGEPAEDPFCYRDPRTEEAEREVHARVAPSRLYELTGTQILRLNTLYQLYADKLAGADMTVPWLNLPEYVSHVLGGERVSEYTNATHTSLVGLGTHAWCREILDELGLEVKAAPKIVPSGSMVGELEGELAGLAPFAGTKIIVPACHDTASAIAAIPAAGNDWAFISSGTWSLVGTVLDAPCVSRQTEEMNFTNLGGVGGKICFLKNVNGMWLLQQCIEEWKQAGHGVTFEEAAESCADLAPPACLLNVDEPEMMLPGGMLGKINRQMERQGQRRFSCGKADVAAVSNLLFHSLAARYAEVLSCIEKITGKHFKRLFIVGGGNRNRVLNRLTAQRTGLEVLLGPTESSTLGNFAVQLAALQGAWDAECGVSASAVAAWAEKLAPTRMASLGAARIG